MSSEIRIFDELSSCVVRLVHEFKSYLQTGLGFLFNPPVNPTNKGAPYLHQTLPSSVGCAKLSPSLHHKNFLEFHISLLINLPETHASQIQEELLCALALPSSELCPGGLGLPYLFSDLQQ